MTMSYICQIADSAGHSQRVQNLAKRVDFFGFERGLVADIAHEQNNPLVGRGQLGDFVGEGVSHRKMGN
jgi:hypothetical protein